MEKISQILNGKGRWIVPRDRESFYLTHDFHPYFAAFPPEIPKKIIELYTNENEMVLDPFMGGGSAIVEAFLAGRKSIGNDISELSKLITKVKVTPINIDDNRISEILSEMKKDIFEHKQSAYRDFSYEIPKVTNIDLWFTPESKYDLAILLYHITKIQDPSIQDFFKVAFSSIIRKVSNATNAQAHLCREKNKKIPPAVKLFEEKILLMASQMKEFIKRLPPNHSKIKPKLFAIDARKLPDTINEEVDLVVTSPPYGTGSKYTGIYRLSYEWLSLKKPSPKETLETSKDFDSDIFDCFIQINRLLKNGKYCFVVYGNPWQKNVIRNFVKNMKKIGLEFKGSITCPIAKVKSLHHVKYRQFIPKDEVLIFQKTFSC